MGKVWKYTRRGFLGIGVLAAGGVAFGYYKYKQPYANPLEASLAEGEATFNPYVIIGPGEKITLIAPRAEMGQGIHTTLAALVAEELEVSLDQVEVIHGLADEAYYNEAMLQMGGPFPYFDDSFTAETVRGGMGAVTKFLGLQITGGSSATIDAFEKMRTAGATARQMLIAAAAARWNVPAGTLKAANGAVINPRTEERLTYGALAPEAAALEPPTSVTLKPTSDWTLLGKDQPRVEGREKVTGGRIFGIDVHLPDMLYATVKISPRFGAGAKSHDPAPAMAVPGVRDVVEIATTTGKGFGIIADNTWAAFQGAEALEVDWDDAPYPGDDTAQGQLFETALAAEPDWTSGGTGDAEATLAAADTVLEARYEVPYLAHATMEPMNATARVRDGHLDIWCGTQAPGILEMTAASLLGLETESVTVHTTRLGGGFGRRGEVDFGLYAAAIAAKTDGKPVKVTWTREEDTTHDLYRPRALGSLKAAIRQGQPPEAIDYHVAAPSILKSLMGRTFPNLPMGGPDDTVLDGAFNQPLAYPNSRFAAHVVDLAIPTGFWRSVGNTFNAWFHECFLDEVAEASALDPIEMRLAMMQGDTFAPARAVLEKAAEMSGWGTPLPQGKARGVAFCMSFGTWVAEVVQVADTPAGIRIEKVWCAADPGTVLDPRNFEAQMSGGIVYGLSQALGEEITFEGGEVTQRNFYDFDAMRMWQCPEIDVAILENAPKMGGAGEPGTPPAAPALTNAIYALTGQRIRRMPLSQTVDFL